MSNARIKVTDKGGTYDNYFSSSKIKPEGWVESLLPIDGQEGILLKEFRHRSLEKDICLIRIFPNTFVINRNSIIKTWLKPYKEE